jgi:hypothetical protein
VILAMAYFQLGRGAEAQAALAQARAAVEGKAHAPADRGSPINGFWFDWAFARILLREAIALTEPGRRD